MLLYFGLRFVVFGMREFLGSGPNRVLLGHYQFLYRCCTADPAK